MVSGSVHRDGFTEGVGVLLYVSMYILVQWKLQDLHQR